MRIEYDSFFFDCYLHLPKPIKKPATMNTTTTAVQPAPVKQRESITNVDFLPTVSIVMPFAPVTMPKKQLEQQFKTALAKVEAKLMNDYGVQKALPVIIKLRDKISKLNYNSTKKSVAIFVSPIADRMYYLDMPMAERISIDPKTKFSDLVRSKKQSTNFLMCTISQECCSLYLADGKKLQRIKYNSLDSMHPVAVENDDAGSNQFNSFLVKMDQGLSLMLQAYPLPVLMLAPGKILSSFNKMTKNQAQLVQSIVGDYTNVAEEALHEVMEYVVNCWDTFKLEYLLKQMEYAAAEGKLRAGIKDALLASPQKKIKLLLIESSYLTEPLAAKIYSASVKLDAVCNETYFMKDELDEVIKNVLTNGGDVEVMEDGMLRRHRHLAFIEA
jgi:hypothetical protein